LLPQVRGFAGFLVSARRPSSGGRRAAAAVPRCPHQTHRCRPTRRPLASLQPRPPSAASPRAPRPRAGWTVRLACGRQRGRSVTRGSGRRLPPRGCERRAAPSTRACPPLCGMCWTPRATTGGGSLRCTLTPFGTATAAQSQLLVVWPALCFSGRQCWALAACFATCLAAPARCWEPLHSWSAARWRPLGSATPLHRTRCTGPSCANSTRISEFWRQWAHHWWARSAGRTFCQAAACGCRCT